MDHAFHGRPPTRRRTALGDASLRVNACQHGRTPEREQKPGPQVIVSPSSHELPHNESLVPNGSLAVKHEPQLSPQNKHLSAVLEESRSRNSKRDSEVSNASTNASSGNGRRKRMIGFWQLGKTIGKGGCSRVRIVRHTVTGQYGAAKIISKATADKVRALSLSNLVKTAEHDSSLLSDGRMIPFGLEREICIMKLLDHPNIVRLYDIWENRNEFYLIMEYVEGGELFNYIGDHGYLPENEVVHIFRQIVAALLYCHRINIHHRDLKPENILLDRENMRIKLVDFGMAALQPEGKKLTTPCGSPHYAAPEVIGTRPYDGAKADVWSCGVILYVLLTGTPPFNYNGDDRNLKHLFQAISRAAYTMPDGLSREAKNLIGKILVVDPQRRISLDEIWDHPFMTKFSGRQDMADAIGHKELWVGQRLKLEHWEPLTLVTIDREILRNMRTLWHSEKERILIERLLDKNENNEKYFYAALQKYQHDQLENYVPSPAFGMTCSSSDYHHTGRLSATEQNLLPLPPKKHVRSQSGYSIRGNEHLYSQHSFYEPPRSDGSYEPPPSEVSYDPFRASRNPVIPSRPLHQNITVHRGGSNGSRNNRRPTTALGHRTGSSLRVQALRNSKHNSGVSGISSKGSTPSRRSASKRRSISRSTLASSSHYPSSPPAYVVRPGSHIKRGVSFSHLRRPSAVSEGAVCTPEYQRYPTQSLNSGGSSMLSPRSSSAGDSPSVRALANSGIGLKIQRPKIRKPVSPNKYIQSEARKVSTELGKHMEEAFNRSSMGSSHPTLATDIHRELREYDSPPTSLSNRDSGATTLVTPKNNVFGDNRPLPPIPDETPNTFVHRKLAETRAEIARRFQESGETSGDVAEVLSNLDRLLMPTANMGKRNYSAPVKSSEHPPFLHVIPEEAKTENDERPNTRRVVKPFETLRLVQGSPERIAPLNIRKRSGGSTLTSNDREEHAASWKNPANYATNSANQDANRAGVQNLFPPQPPAFVAAVEAVAPKEPALKKKKSSWFRRNQDDKDRGQEKEHGQEIQAKTSHAALQVSENVKDFDDRVNGERGRILSSNLEANKKRAVKQSEASTSSEFPMRKSGAAVGKTESGAFKGLLGLFSKKSKEDKDRPFAELNNTFSTSSIPSSLEIDFDNIAEPATRSGSHEYQMNWLSRFLHIKPASKVLCLCVSRGKVRKRLVRLLRDWQRFGVRDVSVDSKTNVVHARIDRNNRKYTQLLFTSWSIHDNVFMLEFQEMVYIYLHLKIKPVNFVIEIFEVLEHGRNANLCLARFTQTRGAASSFRKTVEVIEDVCAGRRMLVEDPEKRAAICSILS